MTRFAFTNTAKRKLREIYTYSRQQWGRKAAQKYLALLERDIAQVAEGYAPTRINPAFSRRFPYYTSQKHHIFFEYLEDALIVVTLFHSSMEVKRHLTEEMLTLERDIDQLNH